MKLKGQLLKKLNEDIDSEVPVNELVSKYNLSIATVYRAINKRGKNSITLSNIDVPVKEITINPDKNIINDQISSSSINQNELSEKIEIIKTVDDDKIEFDQESFYNKICCDNVTKPISEIREELTPELEINNEQLTPNHNINELPKSSFNLNDIDFNAGCLYEPPQPMEFDQLDNSDYLQRKEEVTKIRQYIFRFKSKLKNIIGITIDQQNKYIQNLPLLNYNQLIKEHDNIKYELSISRNSKNINSISHVLFNAIERICKKLNYNVDGVTDNLFNDPDFIDILEELSIEENISKYITPRRSLFFMTIKAFFTKYHENKIKNNSIECKTTIDPTTVEKFKYL